MDKLQILEEIRRTASENGGKALGVQRFSKVTGIDEGDWRGRYWARWGDAVAEAGLTRNELSVALDQGFILAAYVALARKLGHLPVQSEMRMEKRENSKFPSDKVYERYGSKQNLIKAVLTYCRVSVEDEIVEAMCSAALKTEVIVEADSTNDELTTGYVYLALMRIGREKRFKIGKANLVEQRARQVAVNLPEELILVHSISTDDAYGIEGYWHKRFAEKRRGGEWFELTIEDVRAFKRRRYM